MKKIVLAVSLIASLLVSAAAAQANTYIDPNAPFDGLKFFNSIRSGQ